MSILSEIARKCACTSSLVLGLTVSFSPAFEHILSVPVSNSFGSFRFRTSATVVDNGVFDRFPDIRSLVELEGVHFALVGTDAMYRSHDQGRSWVRFGQELKLNRVNVLDTLDGQLFAGGAPLGLWRSRDGGVRWKQVGRKGLSGREMTALAHRGGDQVFAATDAGLFRALPSQGAWEPAAENFPRRKVVALALTEAHLHATFAEGGSYALELQSSAKPVVTEAASAQAGASAPPQLRNLLGRRVETASNGAADSRKNGFLLFREMWR